MIIVTCTLELLLWGVFDKSVQKLKFKATSYCGKERLSFKCKANRTFLMRFFKYLKKRLCLLEGRKVSINAKSVVNKNNDDY